MGTRAEDDFFGCPCGRREIGDGLLVGVEAASLVRVIVVVAVWALPVVISSMFRVDFRPR